MIRYSSPRQSAAPTTDQPAKIADLFAGIRLYGLLGFVWFDSVHNEDWRLNSPGSHRRVPPGCQDLPQACVMNGS